MATECTSSRPAAGEQVTVPEALPGGRSGRPGPFHPPDGTGSSAEGFGHAAAQHPVRIAARAQPACIGCGPSWSPRSSSWPGDNLLRQVVYEGLREDKPPRDVRREMMRRAASS